MFCAKCGHQIPDGVAFCPVCGEKLADLAAQATATVTQAAEPVLQTAENAAQAVTEAVPAPETIPAQPVYQEPIQQPVYQEPVQPVQQPVYQQPVQPVPPMQQPVYQQPVQQPVYQQPVYQQPMYQQPMYQQPVQHPKKKSKWPLILIIILVVLLLAYGGMVVFEIFFASDDHKENRPEWLGKIADFTKDDDESSAMSEKEQKTFTKLVKNMDEAIIEQDGAAYAENIPSYAQSFVWGVYGASNAGEFVKYLYGDKNNGIAQLGDDIKVTEEIVSAKKISDLEDLSDSFKTVFKKNVEITKAFMVTNNSCFKGSEDDQKYVDYYIFFEADDEWNVILVGEENLDKFGLKK